MGSSPAISKIVYKTWPANLARIGHASKASAGACDGAAGHDVDDAGELAEVDNDGASVRFRLDDASQGSHQVGRRNHARLGRQLQMNKENTIG